MNKRDYFIKALQANAFKKREWLNAAFSVVRPATEEQWQRGASYPYRLKQVEAGMAFVDPEQGNELTLIEGFTVNEPLLRFKEGITLAPREIENYTGQGSLLTTYGNCLVNQLVLVLPFGDHIPFVKGYFNIAKVEDFIAETMIDDPEQDVDPTREGVSYRIANPPPPGKIYVSQYLEFCDNAFFLKALATANVASVTPKSLVHHPDRDKVRAAEMAKYSPEELTDPAVIASIGNVLEELDRSWLKDDPSEQYYKSKDKKLVGAVRKRMHYMFGGEAPFGDGTSVVFISKSLQEGLDTDNMVVMNNATRYGSYSRGNQTQLGGETTKTIYRMLGTVRILEEDCKTTVGIPTAVSSALVQGLVGLWQILPNGESELITRENVESLVGRVIRVRGPMTCKTGRNVTEGIAGKGKHICQRCAGVALSEQPGGMAAAAAGVGGRFLNLFLKKMHGGTLKTTQWDFNKHLH